MSQRLSLALTEGALPGEGSVLISCPPADADLSAIGPERGVVVQPMRPVHDLWAAAGYRAIPVADGHFAAAVVCIPRSRAAARARIAEAVSLVPAGAPIWVDGQKTDGIDAILKELKDRVPLGDAFAKAHGKVAHFLSAGPAAFADWAAATLQPAPGFVAPVGVFSSDAPDPGSMLLAQTLPAELKGRVADLGAGWGWLAAQVLSHERVTEVALVEADYDALAAAQKNVTDSRARFYWSDARTFRDGAPYDAVVMNPPFHDGRRADPKLGAEFIRAAAGLLTPGGVLWMVANRHLPYEAVLRERFREVAEAAGTGVFKVFRASHPVRMQAVKRSVRRQR